MILAEIKGDFVRFFLGGGAVEVIDDKTIKVRIANMLNLVIRLSVFDVYPLQVMPFFHAAIAELIFIGFNNEMALFIDADGPNLQRKVVHILGGPFVI